MADERVKLKSRDAEKFEVDEEVALATSELEKSMGIESVAEIEAGIEALMMLHNATPSGSLNKADIKRVKLKSCDGEIFEVDEAVALESGLVEDMIHLGIEAVTDMELMEAPIPLHNVTSKILAKVIEYCEYHVSENRKTSEGKPATPANEIKAWDAKFLNVDQAILFDLMMAADYMNIKSLMDFTCQTVANMIQDKSPEEIRTIFGIENDFTPEDEEEVRKEHEGAFQT